MRKWPPLFALVSEYPCTVVQDSVCKLQANSIKQKSPVTLGRGTKSKRAATSTDYRAILTLTFVTCCSTGTDAPETAARPLLASGGERRASAAHLAKLDQRAF